MKTFLSTYLWYTWFLLLNWEHYIPESYNTITIDDLMMDDHKQKISFVKLQLLCIFSGSHVKSSSSTEHSRYRYYSRQSQNQAKTRITEEYSCFARLIQVLSRWFTWLKERVLTKDFGEEIIKYTTMVFWQFIIISQLWILCPSETGWVMKLLLLSLDICLWLWSHQVWYIVFVLSLDY